MPDATAESEAAVNNEERQRALDGMVGLYRDVTDGIIRAEQRLKKSRALQRLTIARLVGLVGDTAEVAKLTGCSEVYVKYAAFSTNGGSDD